MVATARSVVVGTCAMQVLFVSALLAFGGCAATPVAEGGLTAPVQSKTVGGGPGMRDGRPAFRAAFCSMLREEGLAASQDLACERWLWRLTDEPAGEPRETPSAASTEPLEVLLVTGAFNECVGAESRPFSAGAARLQGAGSTVRTLVVGGRSGTVHNARQIAEALTASPSAAEAKVILVGYSKGTLDILRFLVDYPQLARRVDAVVSVASPIFGTPLADTAGPTYAALLSRLPYDKCPPGDCQVLASLRPDVATEWITSNALPAQVRYYSLAGFTTQERVARMLEPGWRLLNRIDARNDGQVIAADAVIPGATLLGYANADHWGVAQQIEAVHPVLAGRSDPTPYPLEQLFLAIVAFVTDDLGRGRE
jgi:pimeloyl-ACP methyl ester carboxylesterase